MDNNNLFLRDELGEEIARVFFHFLKNLNQIKIFNSDKYGDITIQNQIKEMGRTFSSTLYINFEHVVQFSDELADVIEEQYYRIESYICESIHEFIYENNFFGIFLDDNFPKKFWIGFYNLPKMKTIEKLNSERFNRLDCISGIVTRMAEPYPEMLFGTFECQNNSCKIKLNFFEQQLIYTEPKICPKCYNLTTWSLLFEDSIFIFLQKIKIQEFHGNNFNFFIPKTLNVLLREDNVGIVGLGDKAFFTGSLLTLPNQFGYIDTKKGQNFFNYFTGSNSDYVASFSSDFPYETFFLVSHVFSPDFRFYRGLFRSNNFLTTFYPQNFSRDEKEKILKLRIKKKVLKNLISALKLDFENFENIKIGIILLLVGGVRKKTVEKIHLRGNIHVCLIGNSCRFKNKFLKRLVQFFPKNICINGNISNGEGIAASILKDSKIDKFCIEAGPLALSDKGICCITDFEKIKTQDQISVYEVMEQQIISLTKNGMNIALNARSSILATMDISEEKNKIFQKNSRHTISVFSKFDLFFPVNDNLDFIKDLELSRNILFFNRRIEDKNFKKSDIAPFQLYTSFARCLSPIFKQKSGMLLVRIYKYLRKSNFLSDLKDKFLSIRHLESLIRLSEGFSKIYLGIFVKVFHVKAAARLFFSCIYSLDFNSKENLFFEKSHHKIIEIKHKNKSNLKKKKRINIGFSECNLIAKNILSEIEDLEKKGADGITLKLIIKKILKTQYFLYSPQNVFWKIRKIAMVVRFMVFSNRSLLLVKTFSEFKKKITRLIFFIKKSDSV